MSNAFIRGLGVVDPSDAFLLAREADSRSSTEMPSRFTASGKSEPPPSWKKRNAFAEFKKNLARKGSFPDGEGEEKYADGSSFKGERSNGKRHGKGCFWWPDRGLYVGIFCEGFMHGLGEMRYPAGGKYNGELKLGKRCGLGGYLYSSHATEPHVEFLGQWDDDRPHGWGLRLSKDEGVYLGMFTSGQRHGHGIFISKKNETKVTKRRGAAAAPEKSSFLTFLRVIIKDGDWENDEFCGVQMNMQEDVGKHTENLASGEDEVQELSEEEQKQAMIKAEENLQRKLAEQSGTHGVTIVELLDILRSRELKTITSKALVNDIDSVLEVLAKARGLVDLSARQTTKIYSHYADRVLGF
jgi:hypothetical protein